MQGIIILNKPEGFTSMDCCAIIRKLAHEKKVGHTGTLDPNATGVLPICIGKATRLIEYMDYDSKRYRAGFRFGFSSDTEDIWGNVSETPLKEISEDEFKIVLKSFIGDIMQIPPMYSAKKVNGTRLYDLARSGQIVERSANRIHIYNIELVSFDGREGILDIECSRGTYVRTLCCDIAKKLGNTAVMTSLVRVSCGGYTIDNAVSLDELKSNPDGITNYLKPIESAVTGLKPYSLSDKEYSLFKNGNPELSFNNDGLLAVYYKDKLAGIVNKNKIQKVFNDNF